MKRITSLFLAICLCVGLCIPALATQTSDKTTGTLENFTKINQYTDGQFQDVLAKDWFYENVKSAYEFGLVKGVSETRFNPSGTVTLAETVTLAARINSIYRTGKADFTESAVWYQPYVDYAVENSIINTEEYSDYNKAANRAQFAQIMANALDESALPAINTIEVIPDVSINEKHGSAVYLLYKAGILTGSDSKGTFNPNSSIQRSEVAAIVTRMASSDIRKNITLNYCSVYGHTWSNATCTTPKTCAVCGATEGYAIGHSWINATCTTPKTCSVCGATEGSALGHSRGSNGKCTRCGEKVEVDIKTVISAPTDTFSLIRGKNSVGLVKLVWTANNNSGKTIKYYSVTGYYYNAVGDPAYNDITGENYYTVKYVGPIYPGKELLVSELGYCSLCRSVVIGEITLEYTDGTFDSGWYGYKIYIP